MMERNILLVGVNSKYTHSNLAIRYMSSYAKIPFFECTINDDIFSVYSKLLEKNTEFLCFSVYIWNVEFVVKLCRMLYTANPNLKIIFGGPEAGYDKKTLFSKHPWLFGVCTSEGEEFILALKTQDAMTDIPNLSFRLEDKIIENTLVKTDLTKIKFPYTQTDIEGALKNRIVYFETSRGCIFNCSYCLSSAEEKTRTFPMSYVKNGLEFFMKNKVPLVKLVDRTFNENNERALEIVDFIIKNNISTRFHFEIAPQLLTEEFIELCSQKPEYFQFEMGIQTTNPATMKEINRRYNLDKTTEIISKIPKDIHQHLDLIVGLPSETIDSFRHGFNYVYSLNPHMLQVGFLKLLKHTKMMDISEKFNIKTTEFPPYEVLSTNTLTASEIVKLKHLENAVDKIYNSGAFKKTLEELNINDAFSFYLELGEALYSEEYNAPLSRAALYEFMYKKFPKTKKSLTVDFLNNNRKAVLPKCFLDSDKDTKNLHKMISKTESFAGKKFRLVFAAGCVFAITECEVTEITSLISEFSLQD